MDSLIIRDYILFPKDEKALQNLSFSIKLKYLFRIFLTGYVFIICTGIFILMVDSFIKHYCGFSIKTQNVLFKYETKSAVYKILVMCIFTPFFEEIIFRFWLNLKASSIALSIAVITVWLIYFNIHLLDISNWQVLIQRIGLFFIVFFLIWKILGKKQIVFKPSVKKISFYMSSIIFSLVHITNYHPLHIGLLFIYPIYVLPQLVMGLSFANARLRLGFFAGYALHFLINLIGTFI